jgi:hypothetical protein
LHSELSHVTALFLPVVNVQSLPLGQMAVHAPAQVPAHVRGPGQEMLQLAAQVSLPVHDVATLSVVAVSWSPSSVVAASWSSKRKLVLQPASNQATHSIAVAPVAAAVMGATQE